MNLRVVVPVALSSLFSGGLALAQGAPLAPPPPMGALPQSNVPPNPQYTAQGANGQQGGGRTEQQLRTSEAEDSGRGLEWAYVNLELGGTHAAVEALKDGGVFQRADKTSSVGPQVGLSAGARLLFFTVGARARIAFLPDYRAFNIGPEVGLHIPIGNIEPYAILGGGYESLGGAKAPAGYADSKLSIHGFDIRLGAGLDYYLTPTFSVGGLLTEEILSQSRAAIAFASPFSGHAGSASGTGVQTSLSAVAGLHFLGTWRSRRSFGSRR